MIKAYIRVSGNKQDTENQKFKILDYAQKEKISIDEIIEIEISSTKKKQDRKIDQLIESLNSGDTLIVTELSRLGRKMLEVLNIINDLIEKGVKITFINQPELSAGDNKALDTLKFAIYGFFAQTEREFISARTKQALNNLKSKGVKLGHNKKFLRSKYDDFEEKIYECKEKYKMSYKAIVQLIDNDEPKNWKEQSLRNWFINRYEKEKIFNSYQRTKEYQEHISQMIKDEER